MPYIGKSPSFGVRNRFVYVADASDTSVSGADANGATLTFTDGAFVDVYLNGVLLKPTTDYNTSTANTIAGISSMSANDEVTVIVYDVFTVGDTVSKTDGGVFGGAVGFSGGVSTALTPSSADGVALGSASLEWSDLYLADSGIIYFGNDQDVTLTHVADQGLTLKSTATDGASGLGPILNLSTGDTDIAAANQLGTINFQAPDEGTGTDAVLVAASITAIAQEAFAADANGTSLILRTSDSGTNDGGYLEIVNDGRVRIKQNNPGGKLRLEMGQTGVANTDVTGEIEFYHNDSSGAGVNASIRGVCTNSAGAGALEFGTGTTSTSKRLKILTDGAIQLGSFSGTQKINFDMPSEIFSFLGDATAATLRDSSSLQMVAIDGNNGVVAQVQGGASGKFGRGSSDGNVVEFRQAGTLEGAVSISGSTTSYNAFTGSHWSRLTDNSKPTILRGTVMETIDEMCDWYHLEFTIPEVKYVDGDDIPEDKKIGDVKDEKNNIVVPYEKPSNVNDGDTVKHTHEGVEYDAKVVKDGDVKHVKSKISDTAECTNVYGVFMDWDNDDDTVNDMYVNALGTSLVRIHKDQTVSKGNLLTSNGDGTAKKQDDDIIRSKTIGKVLTNIKQETYSDGSYTVPCALYCG